MRTLSAIHSPLVLCLAFVGGCEFLDAFSDQERGLVNVFVTHHGTPSEGTFPERVGPIEFDTHTGWHVLLEDAWVTTESVFFESCAGNTSEVSMYWGSVPENLDGEDLQVQGLGGEEMAVGNYCSLQVGYGPFLPGSENPFDSSDSAIGSTVRFMGVATRGDESVLFDWSSDVAVELTLDLTEIENGGPLSVKGGTVPLEVVVAKTYDRFFDGIDFSQLDGFDVDAFAARTLTEQTSVSIGVPSAP